MVLKKERDYIEGPVPIDESWWEVILQDVEDQFSTENPTTLLDDVKHVPKEKTDQSEISWEWVQSVSA